MQLLCPQCQFYQPRRRHPRSSSRRQSADWALPNSNGYGGLPSAETGRRWPQKARSSGGPKMPSETNPQTALPGTARAWVRRLDLDQIAIPMKLIAIKDALEEIGIAAVSTTA
ncbi:hypothetical protein IE4803_PB00362 (plasmid) [Rhizobium etli bv. phaseoli str. IE4803]|nr:hypothetical protein IE4803_PB00362 [Rhizobium etli bv. phaseoli str. IE4803]ARQ60801.1 hypothetical protein Kim5_PA00334 [Rhizobium sp. Kim5]